MNAEAVSPGDTDRNLRVIQSVEKHEALTFRRRLFPHGMSASQRSKLFRALPVGTQERLLREGTEWS